jgi:serine/threonine protein kinase
MTEELSFRRPDGAQVTTKAQPGPDLAAPASLTMRQLTLSDGTVLYQLRRAGTGRAGYDRLDNETLAGLRLYRIAELAGRYPPELSRLYGCEATSAGQYVLVEQYRGEPLSAAGRHMLEDERRRFNVSLLTGLAWLAAAGVAHRGIAPGTVRWDGQCAQLTDFSLGTVIGAAREVIGEPPWAAPEQRAGAVGGVVTATDDIWAAGRLIFWVATSTEPTDRRMLDERPELRDLLAGVFGPPEGRPGAGDLLGRLGAAAPVLRTLDEHSPLADGRRDFYARRVGRHSVRDPVAGTAEHTRPPVAAQEPPPGGWLRRLVRRLVRRLRGG